MMFLQLSPEVTL